MEKILGLDLGTNSIGWSIRHNDLNENQIEKYGVITFEKGVGEGKSGEFSFAAERTSKRAGRRLNQARKYRLWATLEVLIKNNCCPMTLNQLDKWRKYDKETKRQYPKIDVFEQWIRLDFNGDGKPDYKSPYQLRADLIEERFDLTQEINLFKIGRAFYHIAQRRGFKSSRKDAQVNAVGDLKEIKSEVKKVSEFEKELQSQFGKSLSDFKTIGSALAYIEKQGNRVRLDWIQHTFRKQYKDEIAKIFEFQGIGIDSDFYKNLVERSNNRFNGAIFYQRPLRSQKGLVGKCTLEPNKARCPISHPEFEEFRALSLLNNVKFKINGVWSQLGQELKQDIYNTLFFRKSKPNFQFEEIRNKIEKALSLQLDYKLKTINYNDKTNISACPVSSHLKDIFGEYWKTFRKETAVDRTMVNKKNGETKSHRINYSIQDIWHILFSFDDEEIIYEFALHQLALNEDNAKKLLSAWKALPEGYAMISLNAIKKINTFLNRDFIYSEAVLLANLPNILGENLWNENQSIIIRDFSSLIEQNRSEKQILNIVNTLISHYKILPEYQQFAFRNPQYNLDDKDRIDIKQAIIEFFGEKTWGIVDLPTQESIFNQVSNKYELFFKDNKREYFILPRVVDIILNYLKEKFPNIPEKRLEKLYHPSLIEIYPESKRSDDGNIYLKSPKTGSFKNPMAMRTLYELRKLINYLIQTNQIDEETRIVVEMARQLNDANKRWAIEAYQRQKEAENIEFRLALIELKNNGIIADPENENDIDKMRLWYEQLNENNDIKLGKGEYAQSRWENHSTDLMTDSIAKKTVLEKYRLWREQQCICMYTGKFISLTDLFDENKVDFEHTIPRSISFDNSLANLTVCYAQYNRQIKKNQIPTSLPNYDNDWQGYTAIKNRLKNWEERIEQIKSNIEFWKGKSKSATDKKYKDDAIRQRHLWQMDLDYWQNKLNRFTMIEITSGFKNSQLVDTQLISKYAFHYLKSVFNKVDVQKGSVTAIFRKVIGIQGPYEQKSRERHSHHSIDATILTMIPIAAKRDEVLKLFYEAQEAKGIGKKDLSDQIMDQLRYKLKMLNIPNMERILSRIDEDILINKITKDQSLTPGFKKVRRRGHLVFLRDKLGNLIKDNEGNRISKIARGDSIRGQLHLDTFYGKIKIVKRDENQKLMKDEAGNWIYQEKNDGFKFVIRKPVNSITKIEQIVSAELQNAIKRQLNNRSLEIALKEGVYMLDRKGNPVGNKIRHIRCFADDVTNPIPVKKQTYLSKHDYKNEYYSKNGENLLYGLYWDGSGRTRGYECRSLMEMANHTKIDPDCTSEQFFETFKYLGRGKNKASVPLYAVLKPGMRVMFYKDKPEELFDLSNPEKLKRLYVIRRIFDPNSGVLQFQYHLDSRDDKTLLEAYPSDKFGKRGKNGFSEVNYENPHPRLLLSPVNFDFLIEYKDFEIKIDGEIKFL